MGLQYALHFSLIDLLLVQLIDFFFFFRIRVGLVFISFYTTYGWVQRYFFSIDWFHVFFFFEFEALRVFLFLSHVTPTHISPYQRSFSSERFIY